MDTVSTFCVLFLCSLFFLVLSCFFVQMTYSIPMPTYPLQKVATLTHWGNYGLRVFWNTETRQVVFNVVCERAGLGAWFLVPNRTDGYNEWFVQEDGNICKSLARFIPGPSCQLLFRNVFVFARPGHGKQADDTFLANMYDLDWSDLACEKMYLEFDVTTNICHSVPYKFDRASYTLAEHHSAYGVPTQEDVEAWSDKLEYNARKDLLWRGVR